MDETEFGWTYRISLPLTITDGLIHNISLLINLASTTSPLGARKTMKSRIFGSGFNYSIGLGESFESHPKI